MDHFSWDIQRRCNRIHKRHPPARVIFATGMNKNSLGADPEQRNITRPAQEIWAPQQALCSTMAGRVNGGLHQMNGKNVQVAILTMPSNIDDACVINRTFVECHGFTSVTSHVVRSQQRRVAGGGAGNGGPNALDRFEVPDEQTCAGIKMANYNIVRNATCTPAVGTLVFPNTVVIPKTSPQIAGRKGQTEKKGGGGSGGKAARLTRRCSSEVWRGAPSFVQQTSRSINGEGLAVVRVELTQLQVPETGDKFASLHAQKSVIGDTLNPEDMPYTEHGIRPDFIVNPFCMPSRMTIGQLEEMFWGRYVLLGGAPRCADATAFRATDVTDEGVRRLFTEHGFSVDGTQVMYNPVTGAQYEVLIALGPVFFTKQRHIASAKINTRADEGPIDPITHQPPEGKKRGGGHRFGGMEIDVMVSHGASATLHSRIPRSSDFAANVPVCKTCRSFAFENSHTRLLHCIVCGHGRDVYYVASHRAFKVLSSEIMATGVQPGLEIEPILKTSSSSSSSSTSSSSSSSSKHERSDAPLSLFAHRKSKHR